MKCRDERGVVVLETMFAIIPFLLLFFGAVQLGLLATAQLIVQHAAIQAARAAAVVIDDDPAYYDYAPRGSLYSGDVGNYLTAGPEVGRSAWFRVIGGARPVAGDVVGPRALAPRQAAIWSLASVAPSPEMLARWSPTFALVSTPPADTNISATGGPRDLATAVGGGFWGRMANGYLSYTRYVTAISYVDRSGAASLPAEIDTREPLRVRVTHLFHCAVPMVDAIMCKTLARLSAEGALALINASNALMQDGVSFGTLAGQIRNERFLALSADAVMPVFAAPYLYSSELEEPAP